ncbi:14149_t:CDS:2, partial [Gigaspora margarita]
MNKPNSINIELEVSNYQDIEPKVSDNQGTKFEAPENEDIEYEISDNHDAELEILAAYDNRRAFYCKTFQNWDQVAKFMKKYAASKGHRIRIVGGRRVNTKTHQDCPVVMSFNDQHVGHQLNPLAKYYDPILQKLPKNIIDEIRFLTVTAKADATMQYRIFRERKFGELWELGRKVITDAIENNNEHIYHELLRLFTLIQKKTSQKIINNISVDGFNNSTNNNSCMLDIQNSIKRKSKGHSKSKRIANAFKKFDTVTNYKCKICKQSSHNNQTCKEKNKEDINADNTDKEFR